MRMQELELSHNVHFTVYSAYTFLKRILPYYHRTCAVLDWDKYVYEYLNRLLMCSSCAKGAPEERSADQAHTGREKTKMREREGRDRQREREQTDGKEI